MTVQIRQPELTTDPHRDNITHDVAIQLPVRLRRFFKRVGELETGRYILTLTIREEQAFWTVQRMNDVER